MFAAVAFYPSLAYNILRNYLQPKKWSWFTRIDDVVLIGALPFQSTAKELLKEENVGGIVCCTEDFETKASWSVMRDEDWVKQTIAFHQVPMRDFTGSTSRPEIEKAVEFINGIGKSGKSVYVHCKAGRTRSTTIVVCYLMHKKNWLPNVAFDYVKLKRPQVILRSAHWRSINDYRQFLDSSFKKESCSA